MKCPTLLLVAGAVLGGLAGLAPAHAVAQASGPYPVAPAPGPRVAPAPAPARPPLMSRRDAIASAFRLCRDRGYSCALASTELAGEMWLVELRAQRGPVSGPLQVGFDAVTRQLVALDEPRAAPPPPPPPPAPAPRLLTAGEAAAIASQACAQRGYACRLLASSLALPLWRVELDARRADRAGPMLVEVDARTYGVVRVDEPAPPSPPAQPMSYEEASRRGLEYCQRHGFACRVQDAELVQRRTVWRVKLAALPPRHGNVRMELDAMTRAVLDVREHIERREWRDDHERWREERQEHDERWRDERADRERER
jgi:hypothetical protein